MTMEMMMSDSWRGSHVIYPRFHAFFVPTEGLLQGWHLSNSQNQTTCCYYTATKIQRRFYTEASTQGGLYIDAFAHRRFYIQKLSHEAFTQSSFAWDAFSQIYLLHTNFKRADAQAIAHRSWCTHTGPYTKKLLDTETFAALSQGSFYTEAFTHRNMSTEAFTQRSFYTDGSFFTQKLFHRLIDKCLREGTLCTNGFCTQQLSHREAFARTSFYTGFFSQSSVYAEQLYRPKLWRREAFTQRTFYTDAFRRRRAVTQSNLYAEQLLHRRLYKKELFYTKAFCT